MPITEDKFNILGWCTMQKLQLPPYTFRIRQEEGKSLIFDRFRRRWVRLTPEEKVRQHFARFLEEEKGFPPSLMAIEKKVNINGLAQRFDLLVYDRKGNPLLVAEFKAPGIPVTQEAFNQALRYNSVLKAPYFLVSNGVTHFICKIDYKTRTSAYLEEIPAFSALPE